MKVKETIKLMVGDAFKIILMTELHGDQVVSFTQYLK